MSVKDTSKPPRRIQDTSKKPKKIDPEIVAEALGAEVIEGTPDIKDDPASKAAARSPRYQNWQI